MSKTVAMGNTSSQPEPYPVIPDDFGDIVPETPNISSKNAGKKNKKKQSLSSKPKALSGESALANGTTDSSVPNRPKRKRDVEPESKQKSKKHHKSDNQDRIEPAQEIEPLAPATIVQPPPSPSQSTPKSELPAKKPRKSRKKKDQDADAPVSSHPSDTAVADEPSAVEHTAAAKRTPTPYSPNPEGSTTPGGRVRGVRGSRTREKDNMRIGFYTQDEVEKIESFKVNFCTMHGISGSLFDEMVQHSERGVFGEFPVSSEIISKNDFWDEIYGLLPDRDRRSVYRFMRRHFQASAQKAHEWTKEQDQELIELHAKHGPKWSYIGKLIGRSDDDVTQRWRNKLEHQDTMNQGAWSEEESRLFLDAVESSWHTMKPMLGDEAGKDFYEMNERMILWGNISKAMGYTRSRQQCADKWRKIVRQVMIMRANGQPGAVYDPKQASKKTANWNTRLEEERKSTRFVTDDSDSEGGEVAEAKKATSSPKSTPKPSPKPKNTAEPSPSREVNVESDHGVQGENEPGPPEPASKAKKSRSKSKRKHTEEVPSAAIEEAPSAPIEEIPSASSPTQKIIEEITREKERREKEMQQQQEQEAQEEAENAGRKDRKRKRKDEKRRKRDERENTVAAAEANNASDSDAEVPEPAKKRKSLRKAQAAL
ncbi:uncharacterized protein N7515_006614 [Penicillium bovifimosum]|uniref:Uncharacterized protein n=1 Tax=Penicillium bovifimosum TaxID=126998 RepID=A0A9W9GV11_9EURO|nr:uncharacterized protein N7515_006614 [Penicillium bovifimosum]KAJ5130575.1 hypothetical protein N7515_006614 [Penicillium bovifimosum]